MNTNRRSLLKFAGLAVLGWSVKPALTVFAAGGAGPREAILFASRHGAPTGEKALKAGRWAMVIDTSKMTPEIQKKCIEVCHKTHNVPSIPTKQEIKWLWTAQFSDVFAEQSHPYLEKLTKRPTLTLCNHCDNPPCVRVCPTKATFQREDGIVMMDFHRCIGCRYCMAACPYGSRSFNFQDPRPFIENIDMEFPTRTKGVVEKCEFCAERLAEGHLPACVEVSEGAMAFGDLDDPGSDVRKLLGARYSIRRKPELGTEPCVYYLI
ncbi:MAG: 4Fe-4S dicluster domain-containing protein [Deltaproteobacteria bacterium]|nr:4Fe-4S dicluster domain-containing protein [Deltaproteobacteria bacterium]